MLLRFVPYLFHLLYYTWLPDLWTSFSTCVGSHEILTTLHLFGYIRQGRMSCSQLGLFVSGWVGNNLWGEWFDLRHLINVPSRSLTSTQWNVFALCITGRPELWKHACSVNFIIIEHKVTKIFQDRTKASNLETSSVVKQKMSPAGMPRFPSPQRFKSSDPLFPAF